MSHPAHLSVAAFTARYKSARTREIHARYCGGYLSWLESEGIELGDARASDVLRHLDTLRAGRKESTIDTILKSIRAYYRWLVNQGAVSQNPAAEIRSTWQRRTQPPQFVPPSDIRFMLASAPSERDRALIAIIAVSSLRVTELLSCNISDLDFARGHRILHFKPTSTRKRPPYVVLTPEIAELVERQLEGRKKGPLFLGQVGEARLDRRGVFTMVSTTAKRAGIPYPVSPQMLTYTLPMIAIQHGYSFRGVMRAMGVPDPRHSDRWLAADPGDSEDNASVRFARFLMAPPDTSEAMLLHSEALMIESEMPEPFAIMTVGAIVERHLRLLSAAHGIAVKEEASKGSITYYVGELQRKGIVKMHDARNVRSLGDLRNEAAHGWFERIPAGSAHRVLRDARAFVAGYPLVAPSD